MNADPLTAPEPNVEPEKTRPPQWPVAALVVTALIGLGGTGYYFLYQKEEIASRRRQQASPLAYFQSRQKEKVQEASEGPALSESENDEALNGTADTTLFESSGETSQGSAYSSASSDIQNQLAMQAQRMDAIEARMDALAQEMESLSEAMAHRHEQQASSPQGETVELLAQFYRLRQQAMESRPFDDALAALLAMEGVDGETYAMLGKLQGVADEGLSSIKTLQKQFAASMEDYLSKRRTDAPSQSIWGDMRDRLGGLVRVRKVGAQHEGDDDSSILARAEAALNEGDLVKASTEISMLSGGAAPYFTKWRTDARRRQRTVSTLERVERRLLRGA
jgi:hypothetical protein